MKDKPMTDARDISHWTKWDDSELIDQAAGACQHRALIDDPIVRDAIAMNIIAPFRQALQHKEEAERERAHLVETYELWCSEDVEAIDVIEALGKFLAVKPCW